MLVFGRRASQLVKLNLDEVGLGSHVLPHGVEATFVQDGLPYQGLPLAAL
jgi:hypothetical protein